MALRTKTCTQPRKASLTQSPSQLTGLQPSPTPGSGAANAQQSGDARQEKPKSAKNLSNLSVDNQPCGNDANDHTDNINQG